jgi:hypothetical protein
MGSKRKTLDNQVLAITIASRSSVYTARDETPTEFRRVAEKL